VVASLKITKRGKDLKIKENLDLILRLYKNKNKLKTEI